MNKNDIKQQIVAHLTEIAAETKDEYGRTARDNAARAYASRDEFMKRVGNGIRANAEKAKKKSFMSVVKKKVFGEETELDEARSKGQAIDLSAENVPHHKVAKIKSDLTSAGIKLIGCEPHPHEENAHVFTIHATEKSHGKTARDIIHKHNGGMHVGGLKEDVEQIDEISTKTLAKAAHAASDPDADYTYDRYHDPQKFANHAKKYKDSKSAAAVQGAADAKGHFPRHGIQANDPLTRRPMNSTNSNSVKKDGKLKQHVVKNLKQRLAKEEVEQIDELSNKTLSSYLDKRTAKMSDLLKSKTSRDGVQRAVKRVYAKEETGQIDELSKATIRSYANKKTAELNDVPAAPFKKPDVSKAEAHRNFKGLVGAMKRLSGRTPTSGDK